MGNTFGSSDWVEKGQVLHFEVDANHVLTSWNTQCESVFGLRSADVVGSPLLSALSLRTEAEITEAIVTALGGKSSTLELATWRPDGTPAVVIVTAIPSANKKKEVLFYGHDISSRHAAQKAAESRAQEMEGKIKVLEASQALMKGGSNREFSGVYSPRQKAFSAGELDSFVITANAPIFGVNTKGLVHEWNAKCEALTGFKYEEMVGRSLVDDVLFPEFRDRLRVVIDDALNGTEASDFEIALQTRDRKRVDLLLNATTRRNASGELVGVILFGQNITERNRTEQEKTRVAKELRTFIDTANAPIFGIDHNGLVNEWNNKSVEITGYSKEEVMGQNLVNVYISEDFRASVKQVLDNALQGQGTANFEFPIFTKDRRRVEILLNATTRCNEQGEAIGVLGVGQDITERKKVEIEKATVAQELQTFIDTANAPIFGIDENGLVNEWNNKSVEITGFSREEVFGQDLVKVYITEEFRDQVAMVLANALLGEETANFEFPLFTKNQQRVEVLLNATTRRDVTGRPIGVIGVGQDITARKQVEQEKSRVAQELQTFIDTANAPIFGCDAMGLVNEWNNKAHKITGYSKEEVLGKNFVEVYITKEFRASVKQVLEDALIGQETANFEFALFTKDNKRVEVLLNATTRRDVTGAIIGMIGVGQDITEKRRLMEQEALLFQAQAANDAKSQFLATMSHEMRTPLNVILGMNDLIIETRLNSEQRTFADQVKTSAESLLILINDILDLTKVEAGKLELVAIDFDIRQVMEDAIDSVASKALGKGLEICSYMKPEVRTVVNGDPDRLRQILLNLLSNGIKFTKKGQVYLLIEEEEETVSHHAFRFKVHDSGIGITVEGQKKLFSRFSQVDSSTTRTYGGTGLGLAISKQFAELMDGTMGVQSEVGTGSLFWFTAVFKKIVHPTTVFPPPPLLIPKVRNTPLTALLKAENETLRNLLVHYLEAFGISTSAVDSLNKATNALEHDPASFDMLFFCPSIKDLNQDPYHAAANASGLEDYGSKVDLHHSMTVLKSKAHLFPKLETIILCPIKCLSHASGYRDLHRCSIISRPVRLSAIHEAIVACATRIQNDTPGFSLIPKPVTELQTNEEEQKPKDRSLRILIAIADMSQRIVLRAMLAREQHQCVLASSGCETMEKLIIDENGWNADCLIWDTKIKDNSEKEIVRWIRNCEHKALFKKNKNKTLVLISAIEQDADPNDSLAAGMNAVCTKPFDRTNIDAVLQSSIEQRRDTIVSEEIGYFSRDQPGAGSSENSIISTGAGNSSHLRPSYSSMAAEKDDSETEPSNTVKVVEGNIKVLVVDDDNGQRMVMRAMLSKMGYFEVATAEDGDQALAKIRESWFREDTRQFDLVLMDGFMPNMTGWDCTTAVRTAENEAGITDRLIIIGVTGATNASDERKCIEAGMTDVTYKPMTRDALVGKISKWVVSSLAQKHAKVLPLPAPQSGASAVGASASVTPAAQVVQVSAAPAPPVKTVFSAMAITSSSDALPSADSPQSRDSGSSDAGWVQKDVPAPSASACGAEPIQTKSSLSGCTGVQSRKAEKGVARKKGSLKVLVVDDGAGSRTTLKALLTRQKHSIEVAKNCEEAISKVNEARFDVAIINASLQGMSGFDIVSQLRVLEKAEGYPPCFVIGVTPSDAEIEECLMSGMNATIAKPVNKDELLELLSKLLIDPVDTDDGESPALDNVQQAASSAKEAGQPDQEHGPRMVPKCPARILIVEDHWANRKLIEAMLLQRGHILDCVENGQEAVTMTSTVEYDLILMDCNMPMMDGWQATEKIRQRRELNASVPIVAVTANAMKGDRDKCIQAGMDDYISKPVDRKKLYEIIAKWTMVEEQAGAPESHTTQRGSSIPKRPSEQKMEAKEVEDVKGPDGESGGSGKSSEGFVSASG